MSEGFLLRSVPNVDGVLYAQFPSGEEVLFLFAPATAGELRCVRYPTNATFDVAGGSLPTRADYYALTLCKESMEPPPEPPPFEAVQPYPIFVHKRERLWRTEPAKGLIFAGYARNADEIHDLLEATWTTMQS